MIDSRQTRGIEQSYIRIGRSYDAAAAAFESSIGRLEAETLEALSTRQTAMIDLMHDQNPKNARPAVWAPFGIVGEGGR